MARADNTDAAGGRFALLNGNSTAEVSRDSSTKSSKRRRRKSAKTHTNDDLAGTSSLFDGSRSGSLSHEKPPLRTISELADLRSNSADVSSSLEVTTELGSGLIRLARQTAEEPLQHTPRKPHASMSFQDSRPATDGGCCLSDTVMAATQPG